MVPTGRVSEGGALSLGRDADGFFFVKEADGRSVLGTYGFYWFDGVGYRNTEALPTALSEAELVESALRYRESSGECAP
jgi:hypothetical protein